MSARSADNSTGRLAPVTYLPGVMPPEPASHREAPAVNKRARNVSLNALTRRDLSRWELEKTLRARGLEEDAIVAELERLAGVGLIDDAALADRLVRTRHERKGLGRFALAAELRARHIDQEHIDAALGQIDDDDEQRSALDLAVKRASHLLGLEPETAKRRLSGYLTRKGYSADTVRSAVRGALTQSVPGVHFE